MANQSDRFAGIVKRFEKSNGHRVFSQVPHGAVPTRIKHGIEVFCLDVCELYCVGKGFYGPFVLLESHLRRGLIVRQIALWIDGRLTTLGRGQGDIDTCIPEDKVWGRTFFKPKTSFTPCVAKLIV